ncbi:MAG: 50S ribosomal protein L16 [Dehalococcoidia bacterium]|nr:50S ribosomal protein L16 [Dehalococcoidia bacterium]
MLQPRRVKYRKQHRGRMRGMAQKGNTVAFGEFGIQSMEPVWLTGRQIEAARRAMTRHVRRGGQIWIRVFPHKSITKKPLETRMGSGKGNVDGWVAVVRPGKILFEIAGVPEDAARRAMRLAQDKLPIRTQIVTRDME